MNRIPIHYLGSSLMALLTPALVYSAPDDVERAPVSKQVHNQFFMDDNNLEANVFQAYGNAKQARAGMEARLKLQINEMHRVCNLTDEQRQKLKLAATRDMRRFFDEFESIRRRYRAGKQDQQAWQNIWQEIPPLQEKMAAGLFGEKSFFAKSKKSVLTDEQLAKYNAVVDERRKYQYRAFIESVMETVETSIPLRDAQHEAIVDLLVEETPIPLKLGQLNQQQDQHLVQYNLSRIPEAKLKSILDDRQWKLMLAQINQSRGMGQFLVQQGVLTAEDIAKRPAQRRQKNEDRAETTSDATKSEAANE